MTPTLDFDALLEDLARRVADQVYERLGGGGNSPQTARLLSVQQAATYLGRSKASVQHLVSDGSLPTVRSDRRVFLDVLDLDRWIAQHKQGV